MTTHPPIASAIFHSLFCVCAFTKTGFIASNLILINSKMKFWKHSKQILENHLTRILGKWASQPVQGKAWQGNKVYAAFLSSPSTPSSSAIIYDIAANEKATDYAAKEPERAAKDFGTNGFKALVMRVKLQDVSPDFKVVDDNQTTGVKKVVFIRDAYWIYWQNIGYYPLTSVSAEFFHDELYRIDLAFSQNQNEIFETFKQRFGPLHDNDTWTRDSMKLKGKSAGDVKLSATILAPEVADGGGDGWDSIVLLDVALSREAEQFKADAPKRAAKDF